MKGKRKRGRLSKTWRLQVQKESKSVGLKKEDAKNRARWRVGVGEIAGRDRKSTRLNSSHANISYAVFCLKKKKKKHMQESTTQKTSA